MAETGEVGLSETYPVPGLDPAFALFFVSLFRKYWHLHAFLVHFCLFDHIDQRKGPYTFGQISEPKKEPNVVPVRIDIIFYHQIVLHRFTYRSKGPTKIPALEIRIYRILFYLSKWFIARLYFLKHPVIVVSDWIYWQKLACFMEKSTCEVLWLWREVGKSIVDLPVLFSAEILLHWQLLLVCDTYARAARFALFVGFDTGLV